MKRKKNKKTKNYFYTKIKEKQNETSRMRTWEREAKGKREEIYERRCAKLKQFRAVFQCRGKKLSRKTI